MGKYAADQGKEVPCYELYNIKVKKYHGLLSSEVQAFYLSLRQATTCWQLLCLGFWRAILDNLGVKSILTI